MNDIENDRDGVVVGMESLACFIVGCCCCVLWLLQGVPGQVYPLRLVTTIRSCKTHTYTLENTEKKHNFTKKDLAVFVNLTKTLYNS